MSIKEYAQEMIDMDPVFQDLADQKETLWINGAHLPFSLVDGVCQLVVNDDDIADAEKRLHS
ncbi:MAG: D-serine ammonia-lyase, partial [Mogibacterium sp.]|nr:D-serine ammonia-lyase [Mogibacterium sp.]